MDRKALKKTLCLTKLITIAEIQQPTSQMKSATKLVWGFFTAIVTTISYVRCCACVDDCAVYLCCQWTTVIPSGLSPSDHHSYLAVLNWVLHLFGWSFNSCLNVKPSGSSNKCPSVNPLFVQILHMTHCLIKFYTWWTGLATFWLQTMLTL